VSDERGRGGDREGGDGRGGWLEERGDAAARELGAALDEARANEADDVTLRRMWARVSQPALLAPARASRPPRWLWFAGGVGTTAALALACAVWLWPRHEAAHGPATVAARVTLPAPTIRPGTMTTGTVRTGVGERLQLTLAGGTEARLESSSVMVVDREGRPAVDGGEIAFSVPHQQPGHSYVVQAGPYRVIVLGTRFKLRLDEDRRLFVNVDEGVVEVWDHARLARLNPGEAWASQAVAAAAPKPAPARERARVVALRAPSAPGRGADGTVDDAEVAARAQSALVAGENTRALALYRALAQRGGAAGENAAYEIGKVLRDRLGQPGNAVAAWRRYRADHPNGLLRVEADVSIVETLVHAGDVRGALGEANDFLRNHPDSERRAEIARVAGDLYRTRADCRHAVAAYETALAAPQVRDAAEPATFHRAECLVRLGDAGGVDAARAYLKRWPSGRFRSEAAQLVESGDDSGSARL
jgi:hypothetical protein